MESNKRDVIVFASKSTDLTLVRRLLQGIEHQINVTTSSQIQADIVNPDSLVILCHRRHVQASQSCLPEGLSPARLIVLSDSHEERDVVDALNAGADHYFNIDESARVLSVRLLAAMRGKLTRNIHVLDVKPFKFHVESRRITHNDKQIHLSPREFALAYFLFSNHSRTVFDNELMVTIWTLPPTMDKRRIDTAVCRIRHKLNLYDNQTGWALHRLRRVGYQLVSSSTKSAPLEQPTPSVYTPVTTQATAQATAQVTAQQPLPPGQPLSSRQPLPPRQTEHHLAIHEARPTAYAGKTSSNVLPSKSTTSSNSALFAINGGANNK